MKKIKDIKDIYWITEWFTDKEWIEYFLYDLYENKYSKWLNEFWLCDMSKGTYNRISEEEALLLTLDYLYPLLRDGKLKIKILYHELEKDWENLKEYKLVKSKEYTQEESKQAIEDIKREWLSFDDTIERVLRCVEYYLLYTKTNGIVKKTKLKSMNNLERFSQ